jgi:hypothetical protein
MIIVALRVLPATGLLLFGMERMGDRLSAPRAPQRPRPAHGRARHLRLVPHPRRRSDAVRARAPSVEHRHAA